MSDYTDFSGEVWQEVPRKQQMNEIENFKTFLNGNLVVDNARLSKLDMYSDKARIVRQRVNLINLIINDIDILAKDHDIQYDLDNVFGSIIGGD